MKRLICTFFMFWIATTLCYASSPDVKQAYHQWCSSIGAAKGDAQVVTKYYASDAILLPTLSPKIYVNHLNGMDPYFVKLTSHPHIQCETQKLISHVYGNIAVNAGLYQFSYTGDDGKTVVLPARFTFVYQKIGNRWMIVHHHSSLLPTEG